MGTPQDVPACEPCEGLPAAAVQAGTMGGTGPTHSLKPGLQVLEGAEGNVGGSLKARGRLEVY